MSDWRPIETAPRDGTEILAWCVGRFGPYIDIVWPTGTGGWASGVDADRTPTHWMPLPEPPK